MISPFFLVGLHVHAKIRSALSRLGGADAIVMQSIVGEELAQGNYVAGFEPATLQTEGTEPTTELPHPQCNVLLTVTLINTHTIGTHMGFMISGETYSIQRPY